MDLGRRWVEPRTITGRTRSSSGQHTTTIRLSKLHFVSIGASRQRLEFFVTRQGGGGPEIFCLRFIHQVEHRGGIKCISSALCLTFRVRNLSPIPAEKYNVV